MTVILFLAIYLISRFQTITDKRYVEMTDDHVGLHTLKIIL